MVYLIKMNGKRQAVLCVLISLMIGTSMFMLSISQAVPIEVKEGFYVTLDISQYRNDVLISRQVIDDDYILRNMPYLWINLLAGSRTGDAITDYKLNDIANVERTIHYNEIIVRPAPYSYIRLGTDNTAVAVTNYALGAEVLKQVVDDGHIWVSVNEFNVTADTTIISDGAYTIKEAGLSIGVSDGTGSIREILICRDVFSGITIVNADVIIIRYIFRFNVGL